MKLYKYLFFASLIVISWYFDPGIRLISMYSQTDEASKPEVLSAVAPLFDGFDAGNATVNKVVVEVKIGTAGEVISARTFEYLLFDDKSAELAAKRWHFAPSRNSQERMAYLTFVYRMIPKEASPVELMTVFVPPYQVEVRHGPITIIDIDPPITEPKKHKSKKNRPK